MGHKGREGAKGRGGETEARSPMASAAVTLRRVMLVSAVLRLSLVVFGEWQDAHLEVRYTDVDYLVFSDVATSVAAGGSPFARATYRYSPLLAYLLLPNSLLHAVWGKFIFSAADLLVGLFVDTILKLRGIPEAIWLWSVVACVVQSLHLHYWHKRKLRAYRLCCHTLDSHMFDEG